MKMEVTVAALSVATASAFTGPFAGGRVVAPSAGRASTTMAAEKTAKVAASQFFLPDDPSMSKAIPFLKAPVIGDGTLLGDVGFDPLGLSTTFDLSWLRAAELKHGRVCMLAAVGFLAPELVQHPVGLDGFQFAPEFTEMNAFAALGSVPKFGLAQIVLACGLIEVASFGTNYASAYSYDDNLSALERASVAKGNKTFLSGQAKNVETPNLGGVLPSYVDPDAQAPGDLGFDPLGLAANGVNPDYALAELKHCRLAMIGVLGMALQQFKDPNGGVLEQFLNWVGASS